MKLKHNSLKYECDQLQVRKAELIQNNEKLSENLKQSIDRTENLKLELNATENLVLQYEEQNRRLMSEIEEQARTNEEIVTHLHRKQRVDDMRTRMERQFVESRAHVSAAASG